MKHVSKGEDLNIQAKTWNNILDLINSEQNKKDDTGFAPFMFGLDGGTVLGFNTSDTIMPPGYAAVVNGFHVPPENAAAYNSNILEVFRPEEGNSFTLAVCLDGCEPHKIARFRVAGPCLVNLARKPKNGTEIYTAFNTEGQLEPTDTPDPVSAKIIAWDDNQIAMIMITSSAMADYLTNELKNRLSGMFSIIQPDKTKPEILVCNGRNQDAEFAGVANINNQSFSCKKAAYTLPTDETPIYAYFVFNPPKTTTETASDSICSIVFTQNTDQVVSTDQHLYYLIGHAWAKPGEINEEGQQLYEVTISQDHPVGQIRTDWIGPCYNIFNEIIPETQTDKPEYTEPEQEQ